MRVCSHCKKEHSDPYLKFCRPCYKGVKRDGDSFKPKVYKKDLIGTECHKCKKIRETVEDIDGNFCRYCYVIDLKERNVIWKERHKKMCRDYRRKLKGIDTELPLLIAPAGSGHICKEKGYKYICRMDLRGHPNADKKGRICEHTLVMSEYLKRPIKKGETIHHKNGIRADNRIENLELWTTSHPPGQRVKDKLVWCKEFLSEYGHLEYDENL